MSLTQFLVNLDALTAYETITRDHIAIAAVLSATAASFIAALVNVIWRRTRLWKLGAPLLSAAVAIPASYLLLKMGAGQVGTNQETGVIVWPPVISCGMLGLSIGIIVALTIGLIRTGGRRRAR